MLPLGLPVPLDSESEWGGDGDGSEASMASAIYHQLLEPAAAAGPPAGRVPVVPAGPAGGGGAAGAGYQGAAGAGTGAAAEAATGNFDAEAAEGNAAAAAVAAAAAAGSISLRAGPGPAPATLKAQGITKGPQHADQTPHQTSAPTPQPPAPHRADSPRSAGTEQAASSDTGVKQRALESSLAEDIYISMFQDGLVDSTSPAAAAGPSLSQAPKRSSRAHRRSMDSVASIQDHWPDHISESGLSSVSMQLGSQAQVAAAMAASRMHADRWLDQLDETGAAMPTAVAAPREGPAAAAGVAGADTILLIALDAAEKPVTAAPVTGAAQQSGALLPGEVVMVPETTGKMCVLLAGRSPAGILTAALACKAHHH